MALNGRDFFSMVAPRRVGVENPNKSGQAVRGSSAVQYQIGRDHFDRKKRVARHD
jgi:hypothetical protein